MPQLSPPGLDLDRLMEFLSAAGERVSGEPLRAALLAGGRSNLTYAVTDGASEWVVRRPPLGHVLETAHDMGREARVMSALRGSAVPVPRVIAASSDASILGAPFYVMERIHGATYRSDVELAALPPPAARALSLAYIEVLAELHRLDPAAVGLGDLGRPDGYLERQVRRWTRQLEASRTRPLPAMETLGAALAGDPPRTQRAAIVHGDYRLDNVMVDPGDPGRILAVFDWEMATLGDPLADLGLVQVFWTGWQGLDNPVAGTPGVLPGFASWEELAGTYAERAGLRLDRLGWYSGFAFFKLAAIYEGIHARHVQGLTVGDGFERIGEMVPLFARRGIEALEGS